MRNSSWKIALWLSFAAAMLFVISPTPARGQDKPAADANAGKGSISGVVQHDGQAVTNARVRLMLRRDRSGAPVPATNPQANTGRRENARGRPRVRPVAEATTDSAGKFTFRDIPAGNYVIVAVQRDARVGGRATISVADGQAAEVNVNVHARGERIRRGDRSGAAGATTNPSK